MFLLMWAQLSIAAPRHYAATGLILGIDRPGNKVTISHQNIAGLMDAMAMPFAVKMPKLLEDLQPGDSVAFTLCVERRESWVEDLRIVHFDSAERDPVQASRLRILDAVTGGTQIQPLAVGEKAEFALTDQTGQMVKLSEFAGKVVVIDFIYTRCPLPDYCFRLSSNFSRLQMRFAGTADLVLLTVTFDPVHDGAEELARYAHIWKADPRKWRFLTGSLAQIQQVCGLFGVVYWPDEGVFTHTLHTAVIDRGGKLAANLEGNRFAAAQLGDLVQTVLNRRDGLIR